MCEYLRFNEIRDIPRTFATPFVNRVFLNESRPLRLRFNFRNLELVRPDTSRPGEQCANRVTQILFSPLSVSSPLLLGLLLSNSCIRARQCARCLVSVCARTCGYTRPHRNYAGRLFIKVITPYSFSALPVLSPSAPLAPLSGGHREAPFSFPP